MDGQPVQVEPAYQTLTDLVRHYSPTGNEQEAVAYLVARMEQLRFDRSYIDSVGNAIGMMGDGDRQLVLLGHIDTVRGELPLRLENGYLHGRGTVDAKGALACFVDAVKQTGPIPGWQLVVVAAVDEEGASKGARAIREAFRPEFAIVGEPSGWDRITLGYKGVASCVIRIEKKVTHGAAPERTASEACVQLWNRILNLAETLNRDRKRVFEQVTPRLHRLDSSSDGLRECAALHITTRLPTTLGPAEWRHELEQVLGDARVRWKAGAVGAFQASKQTKLVRYLLGAIREAGGRPRFVLKSGTADLNVVGSAWGCPAVAYGPGDSNLDHTPEERISLKEYRQAVQVLAKTLNRFKDT